jgi:hypothetical protein
MIVIETLLIYSVRSKLSGFLKKWMVARDEVCFSEIGLKSLYWFKVGNFLNKKIILKK